MSGYRIAIPDSGFCPPVYYCKRATKPFQLDGNIEKEFWEDAPFTDLFVDIEGDKRPKPRFETKVKMLWDEENLYFGAVLYGDEIWATLTERDCVIFYDNDFEIFIDPDSDTHQYYEFEMNALNTVWDLFLTKPYRDRGGRPLNGWDIKGLQTAVHINGTLNDSDADNKYWMVEVVMPFASLKEMAQGCFAPQVGDYYRVNFSRVQWQVEKETGGYSKKIDPTTGRPFPEDNWVWAPTGLINIHYPELWGFLFFTENGEEYPIPAVEYVKWELRRIYYYEHKYFDDYGCFTENISQLQMDRNPQVWPQIEVTSEGFVLSCVCEQEEKKVLLYDDGKVEVLDRQDVEKRLRHIPFTVRKEASEKELPYLEFLYKNMPITDLKDCEENYFLRVVRQALYVREHTPWGRNLPEEIFLNYVLPYRINNEHIVFYQKIFWDELQKELFEGKDKENLTLYRAAVEVNYWCLKKATYQSTNERTGSPLTVVNNAFGRCGEESTLAVAALRSVGIPARQCYAPRWSHCDDNHAWVEVYTEEGWHFLGACEPEWKLDRGWFCVPASKAMLVHTKVYTDRLTLEADKVTKDAAGKKEINVLDHYAATRQLKVRVVDEKKRPVQGAKVRMEVVNFSEFYPIMTCFTDEKGEAAAETGWGDMLLHASKNSSYVRGYFHGREENTGEVELILDGRKEETESYEFTFLPPKGRSTSNDTLTEEEKALEKEKYEEAVRVRKMQEDSFYKGERARKEAVCLGNEKLAEILEKSRANAGEIRDFLLETPEQLRGMAEKLLFTLEGKDLSDVEKEVLKEHLEQSMPYAKDYPEEVFVKDLLNPRIYLEVLTCYKSFLSSAFSQEEKDIFRGNPEMLWSWIKGHIFCCKEPENEQLRQTPCGVFIEKAGNSLSLKVLFVAICRSVGIPARIETSDNEVSYYQNGKYRRISEKETKGESRLILCRQPGSMLEYASNVTVGKLVNGEYKTLWFGDIAWKDDSLICPVGPGNYRIIVTNRQPDESNLVHVDFVKVEEGETVKLIIEKLEADRQEKAVKLTDRTLYLEDGRRTKLSEELFGESSGVLCYIHTSEEPTEHLLNEIAQRGDYFRKAGKKVVLVIREEKERKDGTLQKALQAAGDRIQVLRADQDFPVEKEFADFAIADVRFPLVIVTKEGRGCHAWAGYQVGIADMILKCL